MGERIYTRFQAITPSDTAAIAPFPVNGIYVSATGDLAVMDQQGDVTTFEDTVAGAVIPIAPRRVMAATSGTYIALG